MSAGLVPLFLTPLINADLFLREGQIRVSHVPFFKGRFNVTGWL